MSTSAPAAAAAAAELKQLLGTPPRWSIAVAESLTCGLLQARIGAVSGASAYFRGGVTAYTLAQKVRHLGVDRAAAAACDCVSQAVAEQMARGACTLFDADLALATTGYAEPAPAAGIISPFAWWALAHRHADGHVSLLSAWVDGDHLGRTAMQAHVADTALAALISYLRRLAAHDDSP